MEECPSCKGKKICPVCDGTKTDKYINPHPQPHMVNKETGISTCFACKGTGKCINCNGTGKV